MKFEFHPDALAEYREAAMFYTTCQEGLEQRFIASVEHAIGRLIETPKQFRILEDDIRRCLTRVFPYAILYTEEPDTFLSLPSYIAIVNPDTGGNESTRTETAHA